MDGAVHQLLLILEAIVELFPFVVGFALLFTAAQATGRRR